MRGLAGTNGQAECAAEEFQIGKNVVGIENTRPREIKERKDIGEQR
jgi:hypothetical protein